MARVTSAVGPEQIFDQRVDRDFHLAPRASRLVKAGALARLSFLANHLTDALQFLRHLLVGGNDFVEGVGDFSCQPGPRTGQPHGKIAVAHGLQARQDYGQIRRDGLRDQTGMSVITGCS